MNANNTEKLFSYGTLQYEAVQLANFGRKLEGNRDILPGFELSMVEIKDPEVIATSGESAHPIIAYTGRASDKVKGIVFNVSQKELEEADKYEVSDYKRVSVQLASGIKAWVYVHAADSK
jgi:hypothetical protein